FDSKTKDLGVAVESKFVAVGAVVPFAAARVGAVATQAYANTAYGRDALAMLKRGVAPKDVVKRLVAGDKDAAQRQVGVSDAGFNDRWIDIRVDDHPAPIEELIRIFNVYDLTLLTREDPKDVVVLKTDVVREIQANLSALGLYHGPTSGKFDLQTKAAFEAWAEMNNYEN